MFGFNFPDCCAADTAKQPEKIYAFVKQARGVAMLSGNRTEAAAATIETGSVARRSHLDQTPEEISGPPRAEQRALAELAVAERRVPEINACVDYQRRLIKQLASAGKDVTSAQITLDSLLVSLFLAAEDRHRLRALLNAKEDKSHGLRVVPKKG